MQGVKRNNLIIRVTILALAMVFAYGAVLGSKVLAAENTSLPALTSDKGTLSVEFVGDDGTQVSGATIRVVKVADFNIVDGKGIYTSTADFKSLGTNYDGMTASESNKAAKAMLKLVRSKGIKTTSGSTNTSGIATYSNLDNGMYLVYLDKKVTVDSKKYRFDPFLVQVPEAVLNEAGNVEAWTYSAAAAPKSSSSKTVNEPEPDEPGIIIDTGDAARLSLWIALAMLSVFGMTVLVQRQRKARKGDESIL